ncbi:MAG: flagellar basal body L-ring protein FlgH [Bacteroidetes bacterium]|nr:MAG: flagellar basal body L-ring protein FlgH [Bacteroidota bacterium]
MPASRFRPVALSAVLAGLLLSALPAAAQTSLYATPKAQRIGDVLTVVLAERTSAQRQSGWENESSASRGGSATLSGNDSFAGRFALDASFNRDALNRNESMQSDLLNGTFTALVVGVDSLTGNLIVEGKRKLTVNGESHLLKVSGLVRPFDVRFDNTILSYQIANADIEYRQAGFRNRFMRPAALTRMMAFVVLGAATAVAVL